ncbi:Major Facilitator Superfamily protein [Lentilactobacillus parabuchneri]|jgi:inositol transporter-like SP family MFS transporter|uniref:MFS transporter n=2 Tax=Lentilactobacillus parabuchneri TaxID=152331 RepID=A0A1X1FEV2_9LACO|nr:MFS transporter [Lentilactobacillus parabuchneri]APR07481.1 Major Facilitator Superfamily protein [Lentilactobacillus parabuchneri]KRM45653.1 major facilitator superfamily protein [Lentilactobacillus parabuchneri DSM 5707 = NBRC 107865]MBW0223535.1 sugar porter family MFS transporter [Lentilactobacillus parabuchneri]MCT2884365.1 MFS transporter [Lentilactobacillus parabuchneri]MDG9737114.1 MFS transporter [Lentilactobacillus parabuchneri]
MKNLGRYWNLSVSAGLGSMLGSGIIVGLASTITVWQLGLHLTNGQVGVISGALTFAIAFGSIFGSRFADKVGIIAIFDWVNFLYAIGAGICVFSNGYLMLLTGVVICGIASGTDLPVSLTVISRDAPNQKMASEMVASTQIFWQVGQFVSTGAAFVVSTMSVTGGRIVFGFFAIVALILWVWRTFTKAIRVLHKEAADRLAAKEAALEVKPTERASVMQVLFRSERSSIYIRLFAAIAIYYIFWNFVANTFGQFTTFMFVKAGASQTLSTGIGLGLHIAALFILGFYVTIAGSAKRNTWFTLGVIFALIAMGGLAVFGATSIALIVAFMLVWGVGSMLSGEAIYKVWTQESFPEEIRASIQGFINGVSRFLCGILAMFTPLLVLPSTIKMTMWGFVGIVAIFGIAGFAMIHYEKKYNMINGDEASKAAAAKAADNAASSAN